MTTILAATGFSQRWRLALFSSWPWGLLSQWGAVLFQLHRNDGRDCWSLLQEGDVGGVGRDNQVLSSHYTPCALLNPPRILQSLRSLFYDNRKKGEYVKQAREEGFELGPNSGL